MMSKTNLLCTTSLLAGMIALMTGFILHIPYGANGGYIHLGDALIFVAATILPRPYAIAAALIGAGLADLLTAPMWLPATLIIKLILVLIIQKSTNLFSCFMVAFVTVGGYYLAEALLFGSFVTPFISIPGNLIQALGSLAIYFFILKSKMIQPKMAK